MSSAPSPVPPTDGVESGRDVESGSTVESGRKRYELVAALIGFGLLLVGLPAFVFLFSSPFSDKAEDTSAHTSSLTSTAGPHVRSMWPLPSLRETTTPEAPLAPGEHRNVQGGFICNLDRCWYPGGATVPMYKQCGVKCGEPPTDGDIQSCVVGGATVAQCTTRLRKIEIENSH